MREGVSEGGRRAGRVRNEGGRQVGGEHGMREGVSERGKGGQGGEKWRR